jgi:ERCC4-type nuclease
VTRRLPAGLTFIVDSREQRPYALPGAVVRALPAGDYSVAGFEDRVAVERKTLSDAYSSLGANRERFRREVERLSKYEFAAIIVEASLPQFLMPPPFSRLHARSAIGTLLSWCVRYRLPVLFTGDRAHGEATTRQLLEKFVRYHGGGGDAC